MQANFEEMGLTANIELRAVADYIDLVFTKKTYQIGLAGDASAPDPSLFLDRYLTTGGATNITNYTNNQMDDLLTVPVRPMTTPSASRCTAGHAGPPRRCPDVPAVRKRPDNRMEEPHHGLGSEVERRLLHVRTGHVEELRCGASTTRARAPCDPQLRKMRSRGLRMAGSPC